MIELAATIICAPFILAAVCIALWIAGFVLCIPYLVVKGALNSSPRTSHKNRTPVWIMVLIPVALYIVVAAFSH